MGGDGGLGKDSFERLCNQECLLVWDSSLKIEMRKVHQGHYMHNIGVLCPVHGTQIPNFLARQMSN